MKERNRDEETKITIDYLRKLNAQYDCWINSIKCDTAGKVITILADGDANGVNELLRGE